VVNRLAPRRQIVGCLAKQIGAPCGRVTRACPRGGDFLGLGPLARPQDYMATLAFSFLVNVAKAPLHGPRSGIE
jgi:hypothetical protein